jgi:hypothetical protein
MGAARSELERAASAVLVPEASAALAALAVGDFALAGIFIRASSADPRGEIAAVRKALERARQADFFAACELANGIELPGESATKLPCALALAAAEAGSQHGKHWIRSAGMIAGSEARAAGIELLLPPPKPGALDGFGDDPDHALRCLRELCAGWRSVGIESCIEVSRTEPASVCALARDGAWSAECSEPLLAEARDPQFPRDDLARALASGCDGILLGGDVLAARLALIQAVDAGLLRPERLLQCATRMRDLRDHLTRPKRSLGPSQSQSADRAGFALDAASAGLCASRRWAWKLGQPCEVLAPLQPVESLEVRAFLERLRVELAGSSRPAGALLPVVSEARLDASQLGEIDAKLESLRELGWPVGVLWMAEPRWLPAAWWTRRRPPVLVGFQATALALQSVRHWLLGLARAGGSLPCNLG